MLVVLRYTLLLSLMVGSKISLATYLTQASDNIGHGLEEQQEAIRQGIFDKSLTIESVFEDILEGNLSFENLPEEFLNYQSPSEENISPLMWLIAEASEHATYTRLLTLWLQDVRVNIDLQDDDGMTALMYFCEANIANSQEAADILKLILAKKPNIDHQCRHGLTALMHALMALQSQDALFHHQLIPLLLEAKPNLLLTNALGEGVFDLAPTTGVRVLLLQACDNETRKLVELSTRFN